MPIIPLRNQRKSYLGGVEQTGMFLGGAKVWAKPAVGPAYTRWSGPGWFDASDGDTVSQDTGLVSGLANKRSGGGSLTRAGALNRIALVPNARNGRSALRLTRDASGRPRLTAPVDAPLSTMFQGDDRPYTVIVAYMPTDGFTGYVWTASATMSENTSQQIGLIRRSSNCSVRRQLAEGSANDVNFPAQAANTPHIVAVQHTGTAITVWDTGLTKALNAANQNTGAFSNTLDFALFASRTLGTQGSYASVQCSLDFYEMVVADFVQTEAEITQCMQDLAAKWTIPLAA